MADSTNGRAIIIAAVLISFSIVGGSFFVANSLDRTTRQIEMATSALEDLELAAAPAPGGRPSRPNRPDANREYDVEVGGAPVKGSEDAIITIVEWSDFQCPFCNRVSPTLAQIEKEYGDKVQIAFKHLPLSMHTKAKAAHIASEAAHRQGKFWEMHDKIFADQRGMSEAKYLEYAKELGLDMNKFEADLESESVAQAVENDLKMASSLGVTGTPGFFVNGRFLRGAQPFDAFKRLIDQELAKKG